MDLELLSARRRHSDPPPVDPAIETLAAENVALRGQMAAAGPLKAKDPSPPGFRPLLGTAPWYPSLSSRTVSPIVTLLELCLPLGRCHPPLLNLVPPPSAVFTLLSFTQLHTEHCNCPMRGAFKYQAFELGQIYPVFFIITFSGPLPRPPPNVATSLRSPSQPAMGVLQAEVDHLKAQAADGVSDSAEHPLFGILIIFQKINPYNYLYIHHDNYDP